MLQYDPKTISRDELTEFIEQQSGAPVIKDGLDRVLSATAVMWVQIGRHLWAKSRAIDNRYFLAVSTNDDQGLNPAHCEGVFLSDSHREGALYEIINDLYVPVEELRE